MICICKKIYLTVRPYCLEFEGTDNFAQKSEIYTNFPCYIKLIVTVNIPDRRQLIGISDSDNNIILGSHKDAGALKDKS